MNVETIKQKLKVVKEEQREIREEMYKAEDKLRKKNFEENLLNISLSGPLLSPATDKFKEYMYLTKPITLNSCFVNIYPIWIELESLHPPWSKNIRNLYVQTLQLFKERDLEIVVDSISKVLDYNSYKNAREFAEKIRCEPLYQSDISLDNVKIDFNEYEIISKDSSHLKKKKFSIYNNLLDTDQLHLSIVWVKYLLFIPFTT